jgi:hypothetical protein
MFDALKEYKENHGDCNVPFDWVEDNLPLGKWVRRQRAKYHSRKLSDDRIKHLNAIGFFGTGTSPLSNMNNKKWKKMFDALKEYKVIHGDCNVPRVWIKYKSNLGQWTKTQRSKYKDGKLSADRIKHLEDIGFEW